MKCECCGQELTENNRYCPNCGQNNTSYKNPDLVSPNSNVNVAANVANTSISSSSHTSYPIGSLSAKQDSMYVEKHGFDAYLELWRKYFDFEGVMKRGEFWTAVLINLVFCIIPYVGQVYALIALIGGIGCSVRRLHDTGRSGWYLFLIFVPIIGAIYLIYVYCQESNVNSPYQRKDSVN